LRGGGVSQNVVAPTYATGAVGGFDVGVNLR
jgi:hypothetical protein